TRTHAVTCALCTSSAAARSTITSIANPLHSTENDRRPPGASETDESEERAQGNSPGIRGRLPRQTRPRAHKHHRKRGVRQTTPRSSPIFTRRGWARRRGELAPERGTQRPRVEEQIERLDRRAADDVGGAKRLDARSLRPEHGDAERRCHKRSRIVRPVPDDDGPGRAERLDEPELVRAGRHPPDRDGELAADVVERPERVGGDKGRLEPTLERLQAASDALDQAASVGEGAVDVEQQTLERKRSTARNVDGDRHAAKSSPT